MPSINVLLTGDVPGVWHQLSAELDHSMFRSARLPSAITPLTLLSGNMVDAGFLVAAASETIGSIPILCESKLPMNGNDVMGQFGLKSVAIENGQSSSMHLEFGRSSSLPKM